MLSQNSEHVYQQRSKSMKNLEHVYQQYSISMQSIEYVYQQHCRPMKNLHTCIPTTQQTYSKFTTCIPATVQTYAKIYNIATTQHQKDYDKCRPAGGDAEIRLPLRKILNYLLLGLLPA